MMLRDSTGNEESDVVNLATRRCDKDDRPTCKHCGVSGVRGIENGIDDAAKFVLEPEGPSRVYILTVTELSST